MLILRIHISIYAVATCTQCTVVVIAQDSTTDLLLHSFRDVRPCKLVTINTTTIFQQLPIEFEPFAILSHIDQSRPTTPEEVTGARNRDGALSSLRSENVQESHNVTVQSSTNGKYRIKYRSSRKNPDGTLGTIDVIWSTGSETARHLTVRLGNYGPKKCTMTSLGWQEITVIADRHEIWYFLMVSRLSQEVDRLTLMQLYESL